ncbi:MAG: V-type ATP synthase subunit E [Clostridiales bacterium]|nr:V-type ATP synthase subunit E [Clostridiales bacterium]
MPKYDEKLERFTSAILNDAHLEAEKIKKEIDLEYKQALTTAENEFLTEVFKYIKDEIAKIKSTEGKRLSKKLLDAKRTLFLRRNEIANAVFDELRNRISVYTSTPEYEERLLQLSKKAASMVNGSCGTVVYLRNADMQFIDKVKSAFAPNDVDIREGNFTLGGIVAECKDKRMRIDESFDLAVSERYEHFTEMFGVSLAEL